jgi:hypothetical protein
MNRLDWCWLRLQKGTLARFWRCYLAKQLASRSRVSYLRKIWNDDVLYVAIERGFDGLVKLLAEKGADPDFKDRDGRTPLSQAAANWHEAAAGEGSRPEF